MKITKFFLLSLSLALILEAVESFDYDERELESEEGLRGMYDRWRDHHKVTEKSPERFNVFKENVQRVHNHNKMNKSYKLKLNQFAAMTNQEFRRAHGLDEKNVERRNLQGACPNTPPKDVSNLPPRWDWREHNAVTPVRPIGAARHVQVSVVGAIEGLNAIRTGQLKSLSYQTYADCIKGDHRMEDLYNFAKDGGMPTEKNYPLTGCPKPCDKSKFGKPLVTIDGFEFCTQNSEPAVMEAVARQPVAFYFSPGPDFASYKEGIYSGPCGERPESLLLVGYDETLDGQKFWIAKSYLGQEWGEKGYIRLQRGGPDAAGLCSMYSFVSFPTKSIETRNTEL